MKNDYGLENWLLPGRDTTDRCLAPQQSKASPSSPLSPRTPKRSVSLPAAALAECAIFPHLNCAEDGMRALLLNLPHISGAVSGREVGARMVHLPFFSRQSVALVIAPSARHSQVAR